MKVRCAFTKMMDVDLLVPHPMNPNGHGEKQIELLSKILNHQGWMDITQFLQYGMEIL